MDSAKYYVASNLAPSHYGEMFKSDSISETYHVEVLVGTADNMGIRAIA